MRSLARTLLHQKFHYLFDIGLQACRWHLWAGPTEMVGLDNDGVVSSIVGMFTAPTTFILA